jgi:hypothetical protein
MALSNFFTAAQCLAPIFGIVSDIGHPTAQASKQFAAVRYQEGLLLNKITVYQGVEGINGMEFGFSDNQYVNVGHLGGTEHSIQWDPATDPLTDIRVWNPISTDYNSFARIKITTAGGRYLDAGTNVGNAEPSRVRVGEGGLLLGVCGSGFEGQPQQQMTFWQRLSSQFSGEEHKYGVDSLRFIFATSTVDKITHENITFNPSLEQLNSLATKE